MMLSLHKNATTTPAIRAKIAASEEPAAVLAARYGVTLDTIYRWRGRTSFEDRSHTALQLATTLTRPQEAVVVELRRMLLLPLDDLLAVTREFLNPDVSRSGLDRCLRRHGVSNLNALRPKTPAEPHKAFKTYEPGFLHVDVKYLPQMADETTRRYLFVAIDPLPGRRCLASPRGGPHAGSSCASCPPRPPRMRAGSCGICTGPARSGSSRY